MAGQSDILKEYLLSLGFRIDEKSGRTFDTTTKKFDLRVKGLALGILGVGAAAQAMVLKFSRSMEQLYYKSRLAESTAANLQTIGYAGSQIGLSVDGIQNAVVRMASALRQNPGLTGLLNNLSIPTQGRDVSDVFKDLVRATKSMPFYIGSQYASLFGIGPDELLLLQEGIDKMDDFEKQQREMAASMGLNWDEATKAGKEYSQMTREMAANFQMLGQVLAVEMLPYFREFAKVTNQLLRDLPGVTKEVQKDWQHWAPRIAEKPGNAFSLLLEGLGIKPVGGGVKLTKGLTPVPAATETFPLINSSSPLGLRNNNPGNLRTWGSTPVVNGFAAFGSAQEGLSAMAANLLAYQNRGNNTLNSIIKRWAPASENDTGAYIKAVSGATGFGADDVLNLKDPKVLQALMSAMIKHEQGVNPFSAADISAAINSRLGGTTMIQQTTTIQVHSPDPTSAGVAVARQQENVNANLVRNVGTQVVR